MSSSSTPTPRAAAPARSLEQQVAPTVALLLMLEASGDDPYIPPSEPTEKRDGVPTEIPSSRSAGGTSRQTGTGVTLQVV